MLNAERHVVSLLCVLAVSCCSADSPEELFQQRIMPIFRSPEPSSCVQCHLSSVDLKDYILPSHRQTFVSLRDQGLIELDDPGKSRILKLISMGDKDTDRQAKRIHEKIRKAEYEAFSSWVIACCADEDLRSAPKLKSADRAGPAVPDELIRHARKDRVLDSFIRNVWSQRMRCFPCHTPDEIDPSNPQHEKPKARHREFVQQYGARMNIFQGGPEATMRALITNSRKRSTKSLPLLNLADPTKSLLVLKPTSKLPKKNDDGSFQKPSSRVPVSHMGGLKMHVDDPSYKATVAWIEDYARIVGNEYKQTADLPRDNWYPSNHVLRIKELPDDWQALSRVQMMLHRWNADQQAFDPEPIAFTQSLVTPRRFVNGSLFLLKPDDVDEQWEAAGVELPRGRYLVKLYLDTNKTLASDPTALLGEEDYQGSVETRGAWGEGFKNAKLVSAASLSSTVND